MNTQTPQYGEYVDTAPTVTSDVYATAADGTVFDTYYYAFYVN